MPIEYEESKENCVQELLVDESNADQITEHLLANGKIINKYINLT